MMERGDKIFMEPAGSIILVDWMGDDRAIADAARKSYGSDAENYSDAQVMNLVRLMMRGRHTSPFEMCEVKLLVECPMDVWRQWIRHRTANVNEHSTRYTEAIDKMATTGPTEWRTQSKDNKQGSSGTLDSDIGDRLTEQEYELHLHARAVYQERLNAGVAREQARKDLPLSTYTSAIWKCDLHNLFHFLELRMDAHAQLEIRRYAHAIFDIVAELFPIAAQAFLDYRVNAMTFSAMEVSAIVQAIRFGTMPEKGYRHMTDREIKDFAKKIENLINIGAAWENTLTGYYGKVTGLDMVD